MPPASDAIGKVDAELLAMFWPGHRWAPRTDQIAAALACPLIAVSVQGTVLSAAGGPQTAIIERSMRLIKACDPSVSIQGLKISRRHPHFADRGEQ
jgi:hypothetical protein